MNRAQVASVALAVAGVSGLVAAVTMLADGRWGLLVASVVALYAAFVAATHGGD